MFTPRFRMRLVRSFTKRSICAETTAISAMITNADATNVGILICPTRLPKATLYVLTSESNQKAVEFHDVRSNKNFSGQLENGRAALLLIDNQGKLVTTYNWPRP